MDEHDQLGPLRRQLRAMQVFMLLSAVVIGALWWKAARPAQELNADRIRTRGIIVEDGLGHDRILIGAPFPWSADRVRTDTLRVRDAWAKRFGGDRYMQWYRGYRHDGVGLVVLDTSGFDRLLIGDALPDANTGKRISTPTGMLWNDHEGLEMGGLGVNRLLDGGAYRNGLGLDDADGEGLHLMILEDGSKMMRTVYDGGMLLQGRLAANGLFGDTSDFVGYKVVGMDGSVLGQQRYPR